MSEPPMELDSNLHPFSSADSLAAESDGVDSPESYPAGVSRSEHASLRSVGKRSIDRVGAALLLIACSPVMLIVAILIKATSRGPVIFRAERVGRDEEFFTMYKFRTMYVPEGSPEDLQSIHDSVFVKVNDDGHVTSVGRTLRRFSIDELPQLLNVLKGDLSLVGPRPLQLQEAELLPLGLQDPRFDVRQGITGLWQVSGRSELADDVRIKLDHEYVEAWSLGLDLRILYRTVSAVLAARGAR